MFTRSPFAGTPTFKVVFGLGLCTLGGAMLYAYFRSNDDDEEEATKPKPQREQTPQQQRVQEPEVNVKLAVANEHIPLLVGRNGANLSAIEEKTRTRIKLRDKDDKQKLCEITGALGNVQQAHQLLLKEIERPPIVTEEILVPQSVCGKIMGRCGEAMQDICRKSLAKVSVDSGARNGGMDKRRIIITGTRQQVNIARKMLEDKIDEDEETRRAVDEVEQRREPRRSPTNSLSSSMDSSQASLSSHVPPREKLLAARTDEKPLEVYVSAIASPSKFWVQLIGPQSKKLDDMVQSMTDYYGQAANCELHKIVEPYLGQIVAAVFKYDGKWYRAEIVGIMPNAYNTNENVLDLYFVDYGDSEYVAPHEVYELRTDFLTLRFQAVECFLANVRPALPEKPNDWDPQAIQKFEEITQVANWKKLISRVVTYKERPKVTPPASGNAQGSAAREGSPIPGVELFDVTEGIDINVGHLLIAQGCARPTADAAQKCRSSYSMAAGQTLNDSAQSRDRNDSFQSDDGAIQINGNATVEGAPQIGDALPVKDALPVEDALLQQQLQHLQKNNNMYLDEAKLEGNPAKLSADFFNGNFSAKANGKPNLNGNLSR